MNVKAIMVGTLAFVLLAASSFGAAAQTDEQIALNTGAQKLTADEIAELLVGRTVTAKSGEKNFLFHYSEDNVLSGKLIDGDWSDAGYYGITDEDQVCLSMSKDKGRLRCVTLLELGGTVRKYDAKGNMTFELLKFQDGKTF